MKTVASAGAALVVSVLVFLFFLPRREIRPNVILISIDTLRPDHLGCYGYARNTTPALDAFRSESVLFRSVIASAPSTLPSHASLFTSLAPQHHGASHTRSTPLAPGFLTLTEVLRDSGFRTAAYVGGVQLAPEFGLNQGFDSYVEVDDGTLEQVIGRARPFLHGWRKGPFFLFLHTYQVHHPYWPSPEERARFETASSTILPSYIDKRLLEHINRGDVRADDADRAHIRNAYDSEISSMDESFGELIAELKRLGLYDGSIIVFTSDHGEELGERGFMGWHSHTLYDELLRIPLLIRFPKGQYGGLEIRGTMRSVDIAPLILEKLAIARPAQFSHFSLATTLARHQVPAAPVLVWRESPPGDSREHDGIVAGPLKLADGHVYDRSRDPLEKHDLASAQPALAETLTNQLNALIRERPRPAVHPIVPNPETIEKLRSLGYLQ